MPEKRASIRRQLIWILVYCWLLPVVTISVICVMYIQTAVKDRVESTLRANAVYASEMTKQRTDSVIQEMRTVIYDGVLEDFYHDYARTTDFKTFSYYVRSELSRQFNLKSEYIFAGVCFAGQPGNFISTSQYGSFYTDIYLQEVHERVLHSLKAEDNTTHVLSWQGNIYLYQNLLDNKTLDKYGMIVLQIDPAYLFEYFKDLDPLPQYSVLQLNNQLFWLTREPPREQMRVYMPHTSPHPLELNTRKGFITASAYEKQDNYMFGYQMFISDHIITEKAYAVVILAAALGCVVIPLLGFGLLRIYRNITEPIDALVLATERIENEEWDTTIVTTSDNEFGRLIHSFNKMSSKIKYLFDYAYREELAASESKIMMLQSQLNPHFLNNTLELINWKARLSDNEEIALMIEALGNLLDASLDRGNTRVVSLKEELSYMQSYLFIIKKRFGKRLTVHQHIDERLLDSKVPRLIIQPLIENAVVHGIEPANSGTIDIHIGRIGQDLAIEIINDGMELTNEDVQRVEEIMAEDYGALSNKQRRFGVKNVQERLRLMYANKASFTIQRMADGKTLSRIVFPVNPPERMPCPLLAGEGE